MRLNIAVCLLAILCLGFAGFSQREMNLYEGEIPNTIKVDGVKKYFGTAAIRKSIPHCDHSNHYIVSTRKSNKHRCSGDYLSWRSLLSEATALEGDSIAKRLSEAGITGIVLTYRLQ